MRIADIVQDSIVDGPGMRLVVFTQGCNKRCPNCHNPGTHDPEGGREMPVEEIAELMRKNPLTDGLTLSGGEPFLQAGECARLARMTHEMGLNVWCYSGNTYEELLEASKTDSDYDALLRETDVLVDGRFVQELRSLSLKWRGSTNQRVIDVKKSMETGTLVLYEQQ
jgi:anaerobic ribonucleoside-triphosphate reductase activating protein